MILTANEVKVLSLLWASSAPLTRQGLLAQADPALNTQTLHPLLNSLMDKGCVRVAGHAGAGRGRLYAPALSFGDFALAYLAPVLGSMDLPRFVRLLLTLYREEDG